VWVQTLMPTLIHQHDIIPAFAETGSAGGAQNPSPLGSDLQFERKSMEPLSRVRALETAELRT